VGEAIQTFWKKAIQILRTLRITAQAHHAGKLSGLSCTGDKGSVKEQLKRITPLTTQESEKTLWDCAPECLTAQETQRRRSYANISG
jgi:hypothetical protein